MTASQMSDTLPTYGTLNPANGNADHPKEGRADPGNEKAYLVSQDNHRWNESPCFKRIQQRLFPAGFVSELKALSLLSWPVVVGLVSQGLIFLSTFIFVGHLGQLQLDAASLGLTMLNVLGVSVCYGLTSACDTLFPQTYGSSNSKHLGILLQRALAINFLMQLPSIAVLMNVEYILLAIGQDPAVSRLAGLYTIVSLPSLPSYVLPTCCILIIANVLNVGYLFLFLFYFKFDVIGVGLSLCLTFWSIVLMHIGYIKFTGLYKKTWSGNETFDGRKLNGETGWTMPILPVGPEFVAFMRVAPNGMVIASYVIGTVTGWSTEFLYDWKPFFQLAVPGLFMICLEWWCFEIMNLLTGLLGRVPLAADAVVLQYFQFLFQAVMGLSLATSIRVGFHLGEAKADATKTSVNVSILVIWIVSLTVMAVTIVLHRPLAYMFTNDEAVVELGASIMPLIGVSLLFDFSQNVCSGILRGAGHQLFGAVVNLICYYLIALPTSCVLMFKTSLRLEGLWIGVLCSQAIQSNVFLIRIWFMDWKLEVKKAQLRAQTKLHDSIDEKDDDLSPLQASTDSGLEADHINLSTYSSLESLRSNQANYLSVLQKTIIKRAVFAICLVIILILGIVLNRVFEHLKQNNCFLIQGNNINLTALYEDLHDNQTFNLTKRQFDFLNLTYWFEKNHHGNASFTYCDGLVDNTLQEKVFLNMTSFHYGLRYGFPRFG